ncbi:MAG: AtpZ/AtpI family protein [Candidatus Uhrbacteria bacterium]
MDENAKPVTKKTSEVPRSSAKGGDAAYYRFAMRVMGDFGVVIAVPVVLATFGGIWLDRYLGTTPWLMILGLVGAFSSTYLVIKKKAQIYAKQFEELNKGIKG